MGSEYMVERNEEEKEIRNLWVLYWENAWNMDQMGRKNIGD